MTNVFLRKLFLRIENYLVLAPAFIALVMIIFAEDNYCKVILFDQYFTVSHFDAGLFWCTVLMLPLLLHYLLRKTNKRNKTVARLHVILTLFIVFALPYVYYHTPLLVEEKRFDFLPTPQYEYWQFSIHVAYTLWMILIALQLIFIIYSLFSITSSKYRNQPYLTIE